MSQGNYKWAWLPVVVIVLIIAPLTYFLPDRSAPSDDPGSFLPVRVAHVDHTSLMTGPFDTPQQVTARCLECHEESEAQVLHSSHWTWEHEAVVVEGRAEPVVGGKKNLINNFCIGVMGNWEGCASCHVGYGWEDESFDFTDGSNIDCLACHEQSGTYVKGPAGMPVAGVDLVSVAQSVAWPSRANCGNCHFKGGGGDAVKHGDLDSSLYFPTPDVDIHMGKLDMVCTDCHQTKDHNISGRSISVSLDNDNQIACTDCHNTNLHEDDRITRHLASVACQTCHITEVALREATKTNWDWSKAGDETREEGHDYLKIKGEFEYTSDLVPSYLWYSGTAERYLLGDPIASEGKTDINLPRGSIEQASAKIFPFKIHEGEQIFDAEYGYLLQPKTYGETGYWKTFDWDSAVRQGSDIIGLEYSGSYGFAETRMYWPQTHMVAASSESLQCRDCHSETDRNNDGQNAVRMDWQALGYPGDPIRWGSRELVKQESGL